MKKVIRLTESDLKRIVKRIIKENENKSLEDYIRMDLDKFLEEIDSFCNDVKNIDVENIEISKLEEMEKKWGVLRQASYGLPVNTTKEFKELLDNKLNECGRVIRRLIRKKSVDLGESKKIVNKGKFLMEKSFLDKFRKKENKLDPKYDKLADSIESSYSHTYIDRSKGADEIEKDGVVYVKFLEKNGDEMFYDPKNKEVYNRI